MAKSNHKPKSVARKASASALSAADEAARQRCPALLEEAWAQAQASCPLDLEATARASKALERKREIRSAGDLLRLVLAYSLCEWSLRLVGAWATILGFAHVSDVDLLKRFRKATPWLQVLVGQWFALHRVRERLTADAPRLTLEFCDGSSGSQPGSTGTDWRFHFLFDLRQACLVDARLTDVHTGESLDHHAWTAGHLVLGDRNYARRPALGRVLATGAHVLVRLVPSLPLERAPGRAFQLLPWLRRNARCDHPVDISLWLNTACGRFAVRVVAQRLPRTAQRRAQQRVRRRAQRKQQRAAGTVSLEMARYIVVLTSLPQTTWPVEAVLELYRVRWQIELAIKRLKSLFHLVALRAFDPELAQAYLLGKLLGAALVDEWPAQDTPTAALLADWGVSETRPVSLWRFTALTLEALRYAIRGPLSWARCRAAWPRLRRYLCEPPRRRSQQLAQARRWLDALGVTLPPPVTIS